MDEGERLYREMSEYLIAPYRDMLAEACVTGKAIRVFFEDGQIRMETIDPTEPDPNI